jgi:hypothetical protein
VFTATNGKTDTNKAFTNELEEDLRADRDYSEGWTLLGFMRVCEGLIIKWQKAHYDEMVRSDKRKDTEVDSDKSKRQRAGSASIVVEAGQYCEGCGKPHHKRESCQLTAHPNYNEKGLRIHSEGYKIKKAWLEVKKGTRSRRPGKGDDHPELKWCEHAGGGPIREAQHPGEKTKPDRSG